MAKIIDIMTASIFLYQNLFWKLCLAATFHSIFINFGIFRIFELYHLRCVLRSTKLR